MWFEKFLDIISRYFSFNLLAGIEEKLAELNPDKIYVENVRSILGVSHPAAVRICETAVRQGVFEQGIEVLGPDGTVALTAKHAEELPLTVHCWAEENGRFEEIELPIESLKKTTFYRLNDASIAPLLHA